MALPTLTEKVKIERHEFSVGNDFFRVQWKEVGNSKQGTILHEVTVFKALQLDHTTGWNAITGSTTVIQKWKPTVKRSKKYLSFYL